MVVDCHTHVWERPDQLGALSLGAHGRGEPKPASGCPDFRLYRQSAGPVGRTIVLGFKSRYLGADIPNPYLAAFVADEPERFIGFAGVDPTDRFAVQEVDRAVELGLRGLTLSPSAQDFHPTDTRAMAVYERACEHRLPIVFHQGGHFAARSKMEYARPFLLDEVARTFPSLRMVISHLGYPWVDETVVMLDKHPHVYADICSLTGRPWQAYQALGLAFNAGVTDKLLFGSDFPYSTVEQTVKSLFSLNEMTQGTNLPVVPLRELRGIVERDAETLLWPSAEPASAPRPASAPGSGIRSVVGVAVS